MLQISWQSLVESSILQVAVVNITAVSVHPRIFVGLCTFPAELQRASLRGWRFPGRENNGIRGGGDQTLSFLL